MAAAVEYAGRQGRGLRSWCRKRALVIVVAVVAGTVGFGYTAAGWDFTVGRLEICVECGMMHHETSLLGIRRTSTDIPTPMSEMIAREWAGTHAHRYALIGESGRSLWGKWCGVGRGEQWPARNMALVHSLEALHRYGHAPLADAWRVRMLSPRVGGPAVREPSCFVEFWERVPTAAEFEKWWELNHAEVEDVSAR